MATREPLRRTTHAAVGIGSKLYVWGGYSSSSTIRSKLIEIFDVPSATWEEPINLDGSDMPDGLYGMAVTSDGEVAYCCSGVTGSFPHDTRYNTIYQVTPFQNLCQELQPTSPSHTAPEKTSHSRIVHFQDKLILHGGSTGQMRTNELQVFDLKKSECEFCY